MGGLSVEGRHRCRYKYKIYLYFELTLQSKQHYYTAMNEITHGNL